MLYKSMEVYTFVLPSPMPTTKTEMTDLHDDMIEVGEDRSVALVMFKFIHPLVFSTVLNLLIPVEQKKIAAVIERGGNYNTKCDLQRIERRPKVCRKKGHARDPSTWHCCFAS